MSNPTGNGADAPQSDTADLSRAWVVLVCAVVLTGAIAIVAYAGGSHGAGHEKTPPLATAAVEAIEPGSISVDPPPWKSEEALDSLEETGKPCSGCHDEDMEPDPERRELETHDDIVLKHDEKHRWCLDCHDTQNRDKLRLASGKLIDFTESYRLCGQCHGAKYRDWRAGIHGRRTGYWDSTRGAKQYRLCVHCHYAHAPAFKPIPPESPPRPPEQIK